MWEQLTKKGYNVTNKRLLELPNQIKLNPDNKEKKLIQELALVQNWIKKRYGIFPNIIPLFVGNGWKIAVYLYDHDDERGWDKEDTDEIYTSSTEALIAAIEYTTNNLI
jgi:hypothetical protein